jgi:hypothetical protein
MPRISFFISHSKEPVTENSRRWHAPIPLRLDALMKHAGESVSHAAYFRAAQTFLEANSFEFIIRAASRQLDRDVKAADIDEIRICLEKHGEFYHPARIETVVNQKKISLVLNVAISETGSTEYRAAAALFTTGLRIRSDFRIERTKFRDVFGPMV